MHSSTLVRCLLVSVLATVAVGAQTVNFRGKVEDGESVCYYCPGFGFVIDGTKTTLTSSTISLLPFVGQQVIGTGVWNGSTTSPNIFVLSMSLVAESFSIGGGASIGDSLQFTVAGSANDVCVAVGSLGSGFTNFGPLGICFLGFPTLLILGDGVADSSGEFSVDVEIPNLPALIGLNIFGQGAILPVNGAAYLSNLDMKTLGA